MKAPAGFKIGKIPIPPDVWPLIMMVTAGCSLGIAVSAKHLKKNPDVYVKKENQLDFISPDDYDYKAEDGQTKQ